MTTNSMTEIPEIKSTKQNKKQGQTNKETTLTSYVQLSLVLQVPGYIHISVHILLVVYTFPFLSFMLRR